MGRQQGRHVRPAPARHPCAQPGKIRAHRHADRTYRNVVRPERRRGVGTARRLGRLLWADRRQDVGRGDVRQPAEPAPSRRRGTPATTPCLPPTRSACTTSSGATRARAITSSLPTSRSPSATACCSTRATPLRPMSPNNMLTTPTRPKSQYNSRFT